MDKLNILLCSPNEKYGTGGIVSWTHHITEYYKRCANYIDLTQFYPGRAYDKSNRFNRYLYAIRNYIPFIIGLNKKLKQNKYNVVHLCSSASISLIKDIIAIKIAHKRNSKIIIHFRFGRIPELYKLKNWEYRLLDKVIKKADKVIVIDEASYHVLETYGYKNIIILPNPLSLNIIDCISKNKLDVIRDKNKIVFAGHVVISKGVFELVDACKRIYDNKKINVELIGTITDEMRSQLMRRAGSESSKWLKILGEKDREFIIKEMLSAGIFVLPTYTEGFPNVIIESMACACPIVTTKVGAIPEMLDIKNGEKCGICVEPKNVDMLHDAIVQMLDNEEYARTCGLNAQIRVNQQYSIDKVWNKMIDIWYSL